MNLINEDLGMYLNKLVKTIETQSSFDLGNVKILDQTRIDDILCCIDINFPDVLKKYSKEYKIEKNVHSFDIYRKLIANIKIKPPLTKTKYAVNFKEVVDLVKLLKESIVKDVTYVTKAHPEILE